MKMNNFSKKLYKLFNISNKKEYQVGEQVDVISLLENFISDENKKGIIFTFKEDGSVAFQIFKQSDKRQWPNNEKYTTDDGIVLSINMSKNSRKKEIERFYESELHNLFEEVNLDKSIKSFKLGFTPEEVKSNFNEVATELIEKVFEKSGNDVEFNYFG